MMSARLVSLAWDQFRYTYRDGANSLLRKVQFCLVFFMALLTFTMGSVQSYLTTNLDQLLGADMVITSDRPLTETELAHLRQNSERLSASQLLTLTLTHQQRWQRAQLKIVDDQYPLQGELAITDRLAGERAYRNQGPAFGEVWLDSRLVQALQIEVGESIELMGTRLTLSQVLLHEPDRLMEGHSVAMRAMVSKSSLGSLPDTLTVNHRYLMSLSGGETDDLSQWAKQQLPLATVIHKSGGHPLARFWKRVDNFLGLSSILLFMMGALAIHLAAKQQLIGQQRFSALYLSMGLPLPSTLLISFLRWLMEFVVVLIPALILAYLAQLALMTRLQTLFDGIEGAFQWSSVWSVIASVSLVLLAFQMPLWMNLAKTSVARLVRQEPVAYGNVTRLIWTLLSLFGLAWFYSDNWLLTGLTFAALAATVVLALLLTWLFVGVGARLSSQASGLLPFSLYMMGQRIAAKGAQILGLSLCATLLLFTLMLMKDIGSTMQSYVRTHDGNLVVSQVAQQDLPTLQQWAEQNGVGVRQMKPFQYARLVAVNNTDFSEYADKPSESQSTLTRPIRLHWSEQVPANNRITDGAWWETDTPDWQQISVESEVMTDMGLSLGDSLTFDVNGQRLSFIIKARHVYQSGAGSVTFWFQAPLSVVEQLNGNRYLMGSLEVPEENWSALSELWRLIPTLRAVSLAEMTQRFDDMLSNMTTLVVLFSAMICALAILVIAAAIKGVEQEDKRKNGLLVSFGLLPAQCARLALYEWLVTALIAAISAIFGTLLAGALIYQSQFSLTYTPDPVWITLTLLTTCAIVCGTGWWTGRKNLDSGVKQLLSD